MNEVVNAASSANGLLSFDFSFIELAISSFLGFAFALLVEAIVAHRSEKKQKKQLTKDLLQELRSLKTESETLDNDKVYIRPYQIPVWEGAIACHALLCLDKENDFISLVEVFSSIEEANMIEMKCFELCINNSNNANSEIFRTLTDNRRHVHKKIVDGITLLEKKVK